MITVFAGTDECLHRSFVHASLVPQALIGTQIIFRFAYVHTLILGEQSMIPVVCLKLYWVDAFAWACRCPIVLYQKLMEA